MRSDDENDVEQLIGPVRNGDADAIDAWYRREHPHVHRLCLGLMARAADADDLAQDAMLHLLDRLDDWDARRAYTPWRTRVVVNLCRDRWRRAGARSRAEERAGEQPVTPVPDPSVAAEASELRDVLTEALGALTPREREVFVLRDLEGHATKDAARMLEIGESSVRSLLTLARRRLRDLLGPRLAVEPGGTP